MQDIDRDDFLKIYMKRIESILIEKLPEKNTEFDMLRKANQVISDDILHITRWMK